MKRQIKGFDQFVTENILNENYTESADGLDTAEMTATLPASGSTYSGEVDVCYRDMTNTKMNPEAALEVVKSVVRALAECSEECSMEAEEVMMDGIHKAHAELEVSNLDMAQLESSLGECFSCVQEEDSLVIYYSAACAHRAQ